MQRLSVQEDSCQLEASETIESAFCRRTEHRKILQYIRSLCNKGFVRCRARNPGGVSWTFSRKGVTKSSLALQIYYLMNDTLLLIQARLIIHVFNRCATL